MKSYTIRALPDELHTALKIKAAQEGKTIQSLIVELLQRGIKKCGT